MKKIKLGLSQKFALIDDSDFQLVRKWRWWVNKNGYAQRWTPQVNWKRTRILMHREILGLGKQDKIYIDHKNSNKLDNQRLNLRIATKSQNAMNSIKEDGVSWRKERKKWRARIRINRKEVFLGHFDIYEEAMSARKKAELNIYFYHV